MLELRTVPRQEGLRRKLGQPWQPKSTWNPQQGRCERAVSNLEEAPVGEASQLTGCKSSQQLGNSMGAKREQHTQLHCTASADSRGSITGQSGFHAPVSLTTWAERAPPIRTCTTTIHHPPSDGASVSHNPLNDQARVPTSICQCRFCTPSNSLNHWFYVGACGR